MSLAAATRRPFRWRFALAAGGIGVFLGLAIAEAALRLFARPAEEMIFLSKDGSIEWDCYCSNPRGYFSPRKLNDGRTVYCVDHSRDPPRSVDLADPRYADDFKVLAIGDSFTWGLGVKLTDSWPLQLGDLLNQPERAPLRRRKPVAVSNRGQIGFNIGEIRETYFQAIAAGIPDVCVYGLCLNDPIDAAANRTPMVASPGKASDMDNANVFDGINIRTANLKKMQLHSFGGAIRQHSRVLDLLLTRWEWRRIHQSVVDSHRDLYDPERNPRGLAITFDFIEQIARSQASGNGRFIVAVFPMLIDVDGDYPFAEIHARLAAEFDRRGIEHVDLLPAFRKFKNAELCVHPVDQHPNELAHRLAAEAILERIASGRRKANAAEGSGMKSNH